VVNFIATKFRDNMENCNFETYEEYVLPEMKKRLGKKIAVVGPESSGKSTLVKILADSFMSRLPAVEWGRTISECKNNKLTAEDFIDIVDMQKHLLDFAVTNGSYYTFSYTANFITGVFADLYLDFEKDQNMVKEYIDRVGVEFDGYVLLKPVFNFVDDGLRVMPDQNTRVEFYNRILEHVKSTGMPYVEIEKTSHRDRLLKVFQFVKSELPYT